MLSHVEMGPAAGAGAGFKLFGKVITQPAIRNGDAVSDPQMLRQDHYSSERTSAPHQHHEQQPPPKQELQEEQERDDNSNSSSSNDRANGKNDNQSPASPQEAAETRASAAPLPCPRCRSRDTKFCYFNNYNVNQPRHFCKSCHRYWTAGGALRNVPVGAGRRKNRPVGPGSAATAAPAAGPRAAATAAGFVLGFPSSPSPSSLVYADRPAELDRWFVRTEPPVGSDRRF